MPEEEEEKEGGREEEGAEHLCARIHYSAHLNLESTSALYLDSMKKR